MLIVVGKQTIADNLILLPIELLGIQSFFNHSLFKYAHNSGTWFISCILVCYFIFPFVKGLINNIRGKVTAVIISILLLSYIHYLPNRFECGDLYTNAFLRTMEFVVGIMMAQLKIEYNGNVKLLGIIRSLPVQAISVLILIVGISCCNYYNIHGDLLMYICLAVIFIGVDRKKTNISESVYKVLLYASSISYAFFLAQSFVWNPTKFILLYTGAQQNFTLILGTFIACLIITILLHEMVEIKFKRYLIEKMVIK